MCVLRSEPYTEEWVAKLKRGVARTLKTPHKFKCLTANKSVPCERIPMKHDWPAWWAKLELFRPGVITGPTLYLDLDTICVGDMDDLSDLDQDFAMLHNFHDPSVVGSGVMWFRKPPHEVYTKFAQKPWEWMEYYQQYRTGNHIGDQAFIADTLRKNVSFIENTRIKSYKKHCREALPDDTSIVCFHGLPRPEHVKTDWMERCWT